jgi:geranylgeranyl pyrophosphate synthase
MSHLTKAQLNTLEIPELKMVENRLRELVASDTAYVKEIAGYVLDLGGKRIRPLLVLLCSGIYRANLKVRLDVAAATELVHTASLLHDDVIDEAPIRRGQPSVNSRWGNASSVLAGDYLFARAFALLSRYTDCLEVMAAAIATMSEGELIQLHAQFDPDITPETYVSTIAGKTASLLSAGCECGGMISTMPRGQVRTLRNFGLHLGIAYQIIDDIGDYALGSDRSGKPQGNDIKHGIVTLPLMYVLANPRSRERVQMLLSQNTPLNPEALAEELTETKALEKAAAVACQHLEMAIAQLQGLPYCRSVIILEQLAEQFQQRCLALSNCPQFSEPPAHSFQHSSP